jgi:hypothetical protein
MKCIEDTKVWLTSGKHRESSLRGAACVQSKRKAKEGSLQKGRLNKAMAVVCLASFSLLNSPKSMHGAVTSFPTSDGD